MIKEIIEALRNLPIVHSVWSHIARITDKRKIEMKK